MPNKKKDQVDYKILKMQGINTLESRFIYCAQIRARITNQSLDFNLNGRWQSIDIGHILMSINAIRHLIE